MTHDDEQDGLISTDASGKASIFAFKIAKLDNSWSFFELTESEADIPYHFSFRPDENVIVTNKLRDGAWDEEKRADFDFSDVSGLSGFVIVDDQGIVLEIDGKEIISKPAEHRSLDDIASRSSDNLDIRLTASALEARGDYFIIPVGAFRTKFPKSFFNASLLSKCVANAGEMLETLDSFAATRVFPRDIPVLVSGPSKNLLAPMASSLFPSASIITVDAEDKEKTQIDAAMKANKASARHITMADIAKEKDLSGEVILCGEGVIESGLVKALSDVAKTLHLCTVELEPKPMDQVQIDGGAILGNALVGVRDKPSWTFNYHAKGTLQRRKPSLDIAVAMYNAKDYIVECVESLLTPGRDDVRVIVVDDGSTDGCEKIVEKHFKDDPRVRVETKANGGCASARNYGRLVSNATHITFVDADDFVDQGFYSSLFDLAAYSGFEIVQGGFDFFDETLDKPYYDSYEETVFANHPRVSFGERDAIHLDSMELIHGQPTIWRRVYRRDFLDSKNLYFPENIRAYDDYIFHLLTLTYGRSVLMMPDIKYHYRQHPAQDIKKGDERHFYELYMFRMLLKRSVEEGWPNFLTYSQSVVNTINWSSSVLREDLIDTFLQSGARICAIIRKIYGESALPDELLHRVEHPDFMHFFHLESGKMMNSAGGAFWAYIDAPEQHAETVKMLQKLS